MRKNQPISIVLLICAAYTALIFGLVLISTVKSDGSHKRPIDQAPAFGAGLRSSSLLDLRPHPRWPPIRAIIGNNIEVEDGITEAAHPGGEEYGLDRLAKRVLSGINLTARQMIDHIRKDVADFTEQKFLDDDGTLFVVKRL